MESAISGVKDILTAPFRILPDAIRTIAMGIVALLVIILLFVYVTKKKESFIETVSEGGRTGVGKTRPSNLF